MKVFLYAIIDNNSIPIADSCLCSNCYNPNNIQWYELSYGKNSTWLEIDCKDYPELNCVACGFPIE